MTISGPSIGMAGEDLVLTRGVRVVEHLIAQDNSTVHIEWSGGSLGRGNGVMERILHSGTFISSTLLFNPLLPSNGARYTCQAEINISSANLLKMTSDTRNVVVQSKLSKYIYYKFFWISVNLMCTYNLSLQFINLLMQLITFQFPSLI